MSEAPWATIQLKEPYSARPIRFLELWQPLGWRLKVYGISYHRPRPSDLLIEAAREFALGILPQPAISPGRYGVGFVGIHEGRGANFLFVDWWADENELHHHVAISYPDNPTHLRAAASNDPVVCVWDLRVLAFEREAWLDCVLKNPAGPSFQAYLDARLDEDA